MLKKIGLVIVVISLVLLLFGACTTQKQPEEPIKIGVLLPLTGPLSIDGVAIKEGVEHYLAMTNSSLDGREIQMFLEDEESAPGPAMEKAKRLVEGRKVDFLYGALNSASADAVGAYCSTQGIPMIKAYTDFETIVAKHDWYFCPTGSAEAYCLATGAWTAKNLGWKKAITVASDFVGGRDMIAALQVGFERFGGTIVYSEWPPLGTTDFGAYMTSIASKARDNNIDGFFFWCPANDGLCLLKQYAEFGLKAEYPVVTPSGVMAHPDTLAGATEGALGMKFVSYFFLDPETRPQSQAYWEAFQESYGKDPNEFTHCGYAGMQVIMAAFKLTGGDTNPEKLRQALYDLNIDTILWDNFKYEPTRLAVIDCPVAEVVIKDGKVTTRQFDLIKGVTSSNDYGF